MSSESFYKWRSKYGGMDANLMAQMKDVQEVTNRLVDCAFGQIFTLSVLPPHSL